MAQCRNTHLIEACTHDVVERTRRKRPEGGFQSQEDLTATATRPNLAQVPQHRLTDFIHERVLLGAALLGTSDGNDLFFPVHVMHAQTGNFSVTECVNREQHQDRTISNVARLVAVNAGDETLHISPTGTYGKSFLLEDSWTFDSGCHTRSAPTAGLRIPEERSQCVGACSHRHTAASCFSLSSQKRINILQSNVAEGTVLTAEPIQKF